MKTAGETTERGAPGEVPRPAVGAEALGVKALGAEELGVEALGADPLGEAAVLLRTPRARAVWADLSARPLPGVREVVPALGSVTVLFDPLVTDAERVTAGVAARLAEVREAVRDARTLVLPVTFGGPDLPWCAAHVGLSVEAFVDAVCACTLEVAFLGFTPGFAFLAGLPPAVQVPRLDAPRERVPAGSVALGGPWAGVYPRETPGGWRLIGQTHAPVLDLSRPEAALWQPGDRVRFQRA